MTIGYAICGSFCTIARSLDAMKTLRAAGCELLPIFSEKAYSYDTRFGKAKDIVQSVETICQKTCLHTIPETEPLGPAIPLDALVIAPCTGNTLAKMANGITDSCVTMAAKAHLRNGRPLLIALATNDALSANLHNIGTLLSRKNIYFVPLAQDDPIKKPGSLIADFSMIRTALTDALAGRQTQPLFLPAGSVTL